MTARKNNKIIICSATLIFTLLMINIANAQVKSVTDDLVIKLQHKLLLTAKQTDEIKSALNDYFKNPTKENETNLASIIELSLDEKQKIKYDIIKDDWWKNVAKGLVKYNKKINADS